MLCIYCNGIYILIRKDVGRLISRENREKQSMREKE